MTMLRIAALLAATALVAVAVPLRDGLFRRNVHATRA